jgi:hypothetical protein
MRRERGLPRRRTEAAGYRSACSMQGREGGTWNYLCR